MIAFWFTAAASSALCAAARAVAFRGGRLRLDGVPMLRFVLVFPQVPKR